MNKIGWVVAKEGMFIGRCNDESDECTGYNQDVTIYASHEMKGDALKAPQPCAAPTAVMSAPRCLVEANSEGITVDKG
jgi:hypothetical protein